MISRLPIPTREHVITFDELTRKWPRTARAAVPTLARPLRELPLRISAQVLLVNAFRHYYYATGRSCSDKLAIAQRMRQEVPGYLFQCALESATQLKSNLGNPDYALPTGRAEYLIAQAELEQVRERIEHRPIHEVPLADDRASGTGGDNG